MTTKNWQELERYENERVVRTLVMAGERWRTMLVTMKPGQGVAPHRHEGGEVTLQTVRGQAEVTLDGRAYRLKVGDMLQADGDQLIAPSNASEENCALLITLIQKGQKCSSNN